MAEFHLCSQFGSQSNSYFKCLAHKGNKVDDCGWLYPHHFRVAWRSCYISSGSEFLKKECGYCEKIYSKQESHKWRLIVVAIIMTIIIITFYLFSVWSWCQRWHTGVICLWIFSESPLIKGALIKSTMPPQCHFEAEKLTVCDPLKGRSKVSLKSRPKSQTCTICF